MKKKNNPTIPNITEIEELLKMTYDKCVSYLKQKYGVVTGNYFLKKNFKSKNSKITRGKEGLYIHHIDEDKAIMLSSPEFAINNSWAYQKANRLVYCNLLEHLVLHIKIFQYPNPNANKNQEPGVGGIYNFIVPELNDIYSGIVYKAPWKKKVVELVLPLENDYFKCIKLLVDLKFPYPLLRSFNSFYMTWNEKNNNKIYTKLKKIGVKEMKNFALAEKFKTYFMMAYMKENNIKHPREIIIKNISNSYIIWILDNKKFKYKKDKLIEIRDYIYSNLKCNKDIE